MNACPLHTPPSIRCMSDHTGYSVLHAADAFWRPSNQMRVDNADLAAQLGATQLGMRLWRLAPGQASTNHRHATSHELYVVLEGVGRMNIDGQTLTLEPLSSVHVEPGVVRQIFNDGPANALWLVAGAPVEAANSLEMNEDTLAFIYPDGPKHLPPQIAEQGPPASAHTHAG